ncbi:MAG: M48 family metalloprotease [Inquilinus sp.]|nr:M48 family metalloprotease [Inquilinus sp.]
MLRLLVFPILLENCGGKAMKHPRMADALPILAATLTLLAACAAPTTAVPIGTAAMVAVETDAQRQYVIKRQISERERLHRVAWPLLAANAPLCGNDVRPAFGLTVWNLDNVADEFKPVARTDFSLSDRLSVQSVVPGSPSDAAGLRPGDEIVRIGGQTAPRGRNASQEFVDRLTATTADGPVVLEVARQQEPLTIELASAKSCDYGIVLEDGGQINAYADGSNIMVTRGMMRFVESDDELALVIAHELAHNAMGHVDSKQQNAVAGGVGGLLIDLLFAAGGYDTGGAFTDMGMDVGAVSYSVEFEQEADYVGMYFLERAGFGGATVADFWRRMAAEDPGSIDERWSHPTTPERFIMIELAKAEIEQKVQDGVPLVPNRRPE